MKTMQSAKNTFIAGAVLVSALALSVAFLPTLASAAVCSQSTSPLRNLSGLSSVVITEKTGTNNVQTYAPTSSSLNFSTSDLTTTAVEHYDFFYSDADGTANPSGAYITSKMHRDVSGNNAQAGNNIDSMKLVVGSSVFYADLVASYQLGSSVSSVANASLSDALGAPDGLVSTVGDQDSRITLGFCSAFNTTTSLCSDGLDNDNDGATDYPNDFSCASATDNDETNPKSACQDGQDNDNDNLTDYPQDTGCSSKQDNDEYNQTTNNLSVSCYANPSSTQVNQSVNFYANVSGGTGNYTYSWSGACSSSSSNCYNSFANPGTQTASLYVTSGNQTQNTSCSVNVTQVNQTTYGNLSLNVQVRNLSTGNLNWSSSVVASPSDILQFNITLPATLNYAAVNNVTVRDILPSTLYYNNSLMVDGVSNSGSIISGINIGSLNSSQSRTITYQVQVAPAQNFGFGNTTVYDAVTASSTNAYNNSAAGSASVVITRSGVLGATDVSTGLTNNFWVDSFFLPLVLALAALWAWKSGLFNSLGFAGWVNKRKNFVTAKTLEQKIHQIKQEENN